LTRYIRTNLKKRKSWSFTRHRWTISVNKERIDAYNLSQKGKSWSSNANGPQI